MRCVISCCAKSSSARMASFSYDALVGRYNSDLANGLGNLVSRTLTMINQYRDGLHPRKAEVELDRRRSSAYSEFYDELDFSRALEEIWSAISWLDGYIVQQQPWKLAKSQAEGAQDQLDAVLYTAAEYIRMITALVAPVLPETAAKIWRMLGMTNPIADARFVDLAEQALPSGQKVERRRRVVPSNRCQAGDREDAGTGRSRRRDDRPRFSARSRRSRRREFATVAASQVAPTCPDLRSRSTTSSRWTFAWDW